MKESDYKTEKNIEVVCLFNDRELLEGCLLSSPDLGSDRKVTTIRGDKSASELYSRFLMNSTADYVVLCHQDVYFPKGWFDSALKTIHLVETNYETFGIIGIAGCNTNGEFRGTLWSNGIDRMLNEGPATPELAQSLDEVVIIVNRRAGQIFDENFPGYHLYATDAVQNCRKQGFECFVANLPIIHMDTKKLGLGKSYWRSYKYLSKKWQSILPIRTPINEVTKYGFPFFLREVRMLLQTVKPSINEGSLGLNEVISQYFNGR